MVRRRQCFGGGVKQKPICKAAQPRSSEKNAASRAGQTPCARWAVGICYTRAKSGGNGRESCLRREATLSFFTESRSHGGVRPPGGANLERRRRWREGSQNTAQYDSPDWACVQGKLTFDVRRSSSRALSRHLRALLSACGKSCGLSRGPPLPARTPKVSSYISNGRDRENNDRDRS